MKNENQKAFPYKKSKVYAKKERLPENERTTIGAESAIPERNLKDSDQNGYRNWLRKTQEIVSLSSRQAKKE